MPGTPSDAGARTVGWLELFYDLVFVASIVTFSDAVSGHPDGDVILVVTVVFAAVWWIWLTTTLFANRFRVDDGLQRVVLVQMVLLTMIALIVGDGVEQHEGFSSIVYALLCLTVAVMHGREVSRPGALGSLARARRNEYAVATVLFAAAEVAVGGPSRYVLWILAFGIIIEPGAAYRFGRERGEAPLHEDHLVERLGLLTIIVCGESFVKVSLLASHGASTSSTSSSCARSSSSCSRCGGRTSTTSPTRVSRPPSRGMREWSWAISSCRSVWWGVAVGYAKLLRLDLGHRVDFDKMLLAIGPLFGVYLSLVLVGACTRRVPVRPLLVLRIGSALALAPIVIIVWQVQWVEVDATAIVLAVFASAHGVLALLRRDTHVSVATGVPRTL